MAQTIIGFEILGIGYTAGPIFTFTALGLEKFNFKWDPKRNSHCYRVLVVDGEPKPPQNPRGVDRCATQDDLKKILNAFYPSRMASNGFFRPIRPILTQELLFPVGQVAIEQAPVQTLEPVAETPAPNVAEVTPEITEPTPPQTEPVAETPKAEVLSTEDIRASIAARQKEIERSAKKPLPKINIRS